MEEMERPRGVKMIYAWWVSVEYITSRERTVRLGSLLGLYKR